MFRIRPIVKKEFDDWRKGKEKEEWKEEKWCWINTHTRSTKREKMKTKKCRCSRCWQDKVTKMVKYILNIRTFFNVWQTNLTSTILSPHTIHLQGQPQIIWVAFVYFSSHHSFSLRTCSSSSGVKSFWMLNVLRISSGVLPFIMLATDLQVTFNKPLMSK